MATGRPKANETVRLQPATAIALDELRYLMQGTGPVPIAKTVAVRYAILACRRMLKTTLAADWPSLEELEAEQ